MWVARRRLLVKQGDPLSPILFNLVIDELIEKLGDEFGISICKTEKTRLNCLGYADDLILFSGSVFGMKMLLEKTIEFFDDRGLKLNVKKCKGIHMPFSGKAKTSAVDCRPSWKAYGQAIPMTDITETAKYLGLNITTAGKSKPDMVKIREMLNRVRQCNLRRTQKLIAIKQHIIPKFIYGLGLSISTKASLEEIDRVIRGTIRRILCLEDNFAVERFYLCCKNGGLGVYRFAHKLPLLKLDLFEKLAKSDDPVTACIMQDQLWTADVERQKKRFRAITGKEYSKLTGKGDVERAQIVSLADKVQGFGSKAFVNDGVGNFWLNGYTPGWQGRRYLMALRLRSNLIKTREMRSRGRGWDIANRSCRYGCNSIESQMHALQICPKVKNARIRRHHEVVDMVLKQARLAGIEAEKEVLIEVAGKRLRPDLILRQDNALYVVDVTNSRISRASRREKKSVVRLPKRYAAYQVSGSRHSLCRRFCHRCQGREANNALCRIIKAGVGWKRRVVKSVIVGSLMMIKSYGQERSPA